jgi:hypothetical protein
VSQTGLDRGKPTDKKVGAQSHAGIHHYLAR